VGVQERKYMVRDGDDSPLPGQPIELVPPPAAAVDLSTQATKSLRTATAAVENEVKKLRDSVRERDAQIETLKATVNSVTRAGLERPEIAPIVEAVCAMLLGLVYCRPIDETDRLRIVAAADRGHSLMDQIAGRAMQYPAARLAWEAASREYYDFINRTAVK